MYSYYFKLEHSYTLYIISRFESLLCFFGDFRCGALLFVVIHVIYEYKNR